MPNSHNEKLIFEQTCPGRVGVDIRLDENLEIRTGLAKREYIGLAEVSEPQVIRHFVNISKLNYSIDEGIYPLGSCTMKHNPRINEKIARFDGIANIHPMQDIDTCQGALEIMYDLQNWLCKLSELDEVSLNPGAGAHGELAGLMTIRKALDQVGQRKYVLIPDSAHGTNPSTAAICGYSIKTLKSKADGTVDYEDFLSKLDDDVAALMLTNPNTCGIFEKDIKKMADALHAKGAYLYCDGANFNAIMGKISPAKCGIDVMHFNLHKTFSTPHGGGGPGSGPIAVCKQLAPFLPLPKVIKDETGYSFYSDHKNSIGRIKGFQGQFGMFVRALAYIKSYGGKGLKQVAEDAVLNANYILANLKDIYNVPFSGYCMHECLLTDKLQNEFGITTNEIAKTLIEFGIHPMTVYFPLIVKGAMLIEPTETESKESLDHFIDKMRKIDTIIKSDKRDTLKDFPISTPRKRLDEVMAAKNPILIYKKE